LSDSSSRSQTARTVPPDGAPPEAGAVETEGPPAARGGPARGLRTGITGLELLGGLAAALAVGLVLVVLRAAFQVRSVPERILEWVLLFVPLDVFEAGIRRFGFDAKRYALFGTILATLFALTAIGALALRRRWSEAGLAGLSVGLWLFVMLVVMPLTSAGPFAVGLVNGTTAAVGGYLVAALVYAGVLALFREALERIDSPPTAAAPGSDGAAGARQGGTQRDAPWLDPATAEHLPVWARRASAHLLGGAVAVFALTAFALRFGPRRRLTGVVVLDPQAPVPSGGIEPPIAHPSSIGTVSPPVSRPGASSGQEPPPARQLARDKDGAALPSGRKAGQLAEPITSNADFYIVTKNAGGDPVLNTTDWRLRIDGEVGRPVEVDLASLRRLPAVEVTKTLECISNFAAKCELAPFGCDLISTARWKGVRVSDVLALAGGAKPGAVSLATFAADEFTTALPIEVALAPETLLVYEMNGQMLPREHGYPLRMLVPGRYGMKNAKWVVALRVMNREFIDWYGQRNWSRTATVKTMSRIDVPAPGATLASGEQRIAGIAYAGDRGIAYVEYSADGGLTWAVAELLEQPASRDVWVRWQGSFVVQPGQETITLVARATDGTGQTQPEPFVLPQPDGSSGWCSIDVKAART
jgi:DMSO/TMAO reductase YedYZ molybdopterin-dependent catalytic subunit